MSLPPPTSDDGMSPVRAGAILVLAYVLWGISPIYFKLASFASPIEIVLHRAVWSAPILAGLLIYWRRMNAALVVVRNWRAMGLLAITAAIIASNWLVFIWAINNERLLDVSLGYFINPLMNVAVGVFIADERFSKWRFLAVGLAAAGVINQMIQLGEVPWIGLYLAVSFTIYGFIRKRISVDGPTGLFWETSLIFIPSVFILGAFQMNGGDTFTDGSYQAAMLMAAGLVTVTPLLFWVISARHLSFAVIGITQFIAPSIQFCVALFYGEVFTLAHAITFGCIWLGLAVFVGDLLWFERQKAQQTQTG